MLFLARSLFKVQYCGMTCHRPSKEEGAWGSLGFSVCHIWVDLRATVIKMKMNWDGISYRADHILSVHNEF
jgi:hypothetical protein